MWTGGEDTGGIDSAIASTALGESHPNKPNTPSECLSVAGQTNWTHFRDEPSGSADTRKWVVHHRALRVWTTLSPCSSRFMSLRLAVLSTISHEMVTSTNSRLVPRR